MNYPYHLRKQVKTPDEELLQRSVLRIKKKLEEKARSWGTDDQS